MQELTYEEMTEARKTVTKKYAIPDDATPVKVDVRDDKNGVMLIVDGKAIIMPIEGARNLALVLRQSANRIERQGR